MTRLGFLARLLGLGAPMLALAACVSIGDPHYDPEAERAGSAYGAFLAAQYAGRIAARSVRAAEA